MDDDTETKSVWRRLVREEELTFIGYCSDEQAYFEDTDEQTMIELFLKKRLINNRKAVRVKVTVSILKKP